MMYWGRNMGPVEREKGFTLMELLTVVAIIGILASIAIPKWVHYRSRAYDMAAHSDLQNAFRFSQAHFSEHPNDVIDLPSLMAEGFRQTKYVKVKILDGSLDGLKIESFHEAGNTIYSIDAAGKVKPPPN